MTAVLVATGCGTSGLPEAGAGDSARGKELFVERCGSCHVLADAGSQGQVGPNLDDAFRQARADGLGENTIQAVVRGQISYPVENPPTGTPGMPADIVTGEDADSVAKYVASVAGLPVRAQPGVTATGGTETGGTETGGTETGGTETGGTETGGTETGGTETGGTETGGTETGGTETGGAGEAADGEAIFAEAGCGGCHTLEAAGASGTVGPNLDESKPTKELVVDRVTNGRGAMPAFKDSYSAEQIEAVADFVVASTR